MTPFSLGMMGMLYAKRRNVPVTASYTTDFVAYLKHYNLALLEKPLWRFFSWFHGHTVANFVASKSSAEQLKEQKIGNIRFWGRGIDCDSFNPERRSEKVRKELGVAEGEKMLLYVGRLAAEKELDVLLSAYEKLRENNTSIKLVMVGDGPYRKNIVERSIEGVILPGYRIGKELQSIYASADVFVFPSSTETYGNVILEAMASGLPVVATCSGGVKENLLHDFNGLAHITGDSADMAEKISLLTGNEALRERMGENARHFTLNKSWKRIHEELFQIFEKLIKKTENFSSEKFSA